jgi:Domain of unknown function (DUF4411)
MPFSLDTSGLLDAWVRHYPPDVFPTIWTHMEIACRRGEIFIIDEVLDELARKDDGIHKWVKEHEQMVVSIDEEIQEYLAKMMKAHPRLVDTKKNRSGCDPWVIALAQARNLTVVTGERGSGKIEKPKIPDVCRSLNVPCIEIIDFFRKQGLRI